MIGHRTEDLKHFAKSIGFDRIGITGAKPLKDFDRFEEWIHQGFAGDMWYLKDESRKNKRKDPRHILPGARSIIVGAISYAPEMRTHRTDAKFARYGWGADYHNVVKEKLEQIAKWLSERSLEPFSYLTYVDTGPILERSLAEQAGVGWIGKNTCVMSEETGSYIYLGEIITTLALDEDLPAINRCGTCTRCLDACPTKAFVAPYVLDATRCISYQTIENKNLEIPPSVAENLGGWIAGCDICQEVCPWNAETLSVRLTELKPKAHIDFTLKQVLNLPPEDLKDLLKETSFKRIGWEKLKKNAELNLK